MTNVLEYFGAFVSHTATAAAARAQLRTIAPNVVVADFQLPHHDAAWLIRQARRLGFYGPFIAVSGLDFHPQQLVDYGFEARLPRVRYRSKRARLLRRFVSHRSANRMPWYSRAVRS
jgi:CheY-like chemotaxis protein